MLMFVFTGSTEAAGRLATACVRETQLRRGIRRVKGHGIHRESLTAGEYVFQRARLLIVYIFICVLRFFCFRCEWPMGSNQVSTGVERLPQ